MKKFTPAFDEFAPAFFAKYAGFSDKTNEDQK